MEEEEDLEEKRAELGTDKEGEQRKKTEGQGQGQGQGPEGPERQMEEGEENEANSPIPIDRGWAWMVVVGCFGMHVLVVGGVKSFGVLFVEFQQLYDVSAKQLGVVHGLASVLMMALGPVSNALSIRFSCRSVVFCGGVLMGCGFVSSAFVPTFTWLYLTYSILTGLGSALAYAPSVVMVGHHFTQRRALANGISVSGSAVGSFVLPNLMRYLLNQYGLRGALAIIGAIMFHVCACAALFRPLSSYKFPRQAKRERPASSYTLNDEEDVSACVNQDETDRSCQPKEDDLTCPSPDEEACNLSLEDDDLTDLTTPKPAETDDLATPKPAETDDLATPKPAESDDLATPKPAESDDLATPKPAESDDLTTPKPDESDDLATPKPAESDDLTTPKPAESDEVSGNVEESNVSSLHPNQDIEEHPTGVSPTTPTTPSDDLKQITESEKSPDLRRLANINSPDSVRRTGSTDDAAELHKVEISKRSQSCDMDPDGQGDQHLQRKPHADRSPQLRRAESTPNSSTPELMEFSQKSPIPGKTDNIPRSPNLARMTEAMKSPRVNELRRSPNLGRADSFSYSDVTSTYQGHKNGPTSAVPSADSETQGEVITASTILDSLEKKLARNASVNSMITHFGSMKQTTRDPERPGSFKFNFRRDSSKSKQSGSLKRRAFKGGKPILERHPSALWDARLPESLKQAIEEEKRKPQRGDSIELSLLTRGSSSQNLVENSPLQRSGSKTSTASTPANKRIGSFKAIDAAKPIRFIQDRKKLLLASNLRYRSETRDAGVATPTLIANEKVPLKRFYSVQAGHQPSPVLHDSYLHRRVRQISEAESWRSESSVFASAGDLALASLQNISLSLKEDDEDELSTTSRASGVKSLLRLSAKTVYKGEKKKTSVPLFELSLMLNPVFLVFFMSLVCMNFGYPNIFVMLPSYCQHEVGMDKTTAAFMVSIIGLTDLVGRLFIGWFSDLRLFPRKYGFMVSLAVAGLLCTVLPRMKSFQGLVIFACGFGFCGGCFIALIAVILVDSLGKEHLASSFGLASVAMAVGLMAGPTIYGDIRDTTGSWDVAFLVSGFMSLAAASCIFIQPLAQHVLSRPIKSTEHQVRDEML